MWKDTNKLVHQNEVKKFEKKKQEKAEKSLSHDFKNNNRKFWIIE